jgi:DNA invertase Pin-like site-specific DNA recombinase
MRYYTELITRNPDYEMVDIYADEGISGTNTKKRDDFNRMIVDCRAGKIDLIITKSISRFARNTLDCLNYVRELKDLGIGIIFEKENINTLDAKGEVLLTILSSLAQDESRSISENSTWGIRRRFEQGKHKMSTKRFLGYDTDEEGHLIVNRQQAKIVVRLYEEFLSGKTVDYIARIFKAEKIRNWDGKYNWQASTLGSMLRNEKYMGDAILQKSYTADFLSKRRVMNDGRVQMYHIEEDHEPIIDIETWEAVQAELARREQYCTEHFTNAYSQKSETNPFYAKIICGNCSNIYSRVRYTTKAGRQITKWRCGSSNKTNGHKVCTNRYVTEETFKKLFVMSWNEMVVHQEEYKEHWNENIKSEDVLLRYKTRLLMKHVAAGEIKDFEPELMMVVMDHITVFEDGRLQIKFYDETEFGVETE